ncbi:MAG: mannosyltransferase [Cirrosporium novae-zelandiae]|nr:MAG: mannosyltransferase [Cirrosporium novae-zelandiae]
MVKKPPRSRASPITNVSATSKGPDPKPSHKFFIPPIIAFYIFFLYTILSALFAPIQDCDETFNYWEPTHYLNHGYGLQTWEYSPEYSIRSWFYIILHAIPGKAMYLLSGSKMVEFYSIRIMLGLFCSIAETRLYSAISRTLNPRLGVIFLMIMVFSPGTFHAATAYLPSSFAMTTSMLGLTAFMDCYGGPKTAQGIMWFGIGGIVGWPFSAALIEPLVADEIMATFVTKKWFEVTRRFLDGAAIEMGIDAFFYHKIVLVPWRIVFYNVLSASKDHGPDIFGTEPWHFYIRNLLLNFNVWFVLAVAVGPLLLLQLVFRTQSTTKQTIMRSFTFIAPFYIWLGIFTLQAHKEERFMYPAYPFLALNAAIGLHIILSYIGSSNPRELIGRIPARIKFLFVSSLIISSVDIGILRTLGSVTAYNAPLQIYQKLNDVARPSDVLCLGKEWYRFPSSHFLPNGMHAKFIKSEFNGLLPGEFREADVGSGFFPGTWLIPPGMNDRNEEDPGKHVDISHCNYLVDSYFPGVNGTDLEPNYILDTDTWEALTCSKFLDHSQTDIVGRMLWVPDSALIPEQFQRKWGQYCLLQRRMSST